MVEFTGGVGGAGGGGGVGGEEPGVREDRKEGAGSWGPR
jgi:hypothetical protein